MLVFNSSTKGSFIGYFRLPQSTLCSRMWNTPVESSGSVRNVMENTMFSAPLSSQKTCAPVFTCSMKNVFPPASRHSAARHTRNPLTVWFSVYFISVSTCILS